MDDAPKQLHSNVLHPIYGTKKPKNQQEKNKLCEEINRYLDAIKAKILIMQREMELDGAIISPRTLLDRLHGRDDSRKMLRAVFEEHNTQIEKLAGVEISITTVRRYEKSLTTLLNFIKTTYKIDDIPLQNITPKFISDYEIYLRTQCKCSHNTAVKRLKNLKKITRIGLINGWITSNPFAHTKLKEKCAEREFLTSDEIETMINKKFSIPRLEQVRDVYIFCALTGLSFSDVQQLQPEHIIKDTQGNNWTAKRGSAAGTPTHIELTNSGKYTNNSECSTRQILAMIF